MTESDLYEPVRDWLEHNGYTVRAEVRHCDVAATRGDDLVVVELKASLSLALLAQAARRQRYADSVYVAVSRPANRLLWRARSRDTLHLLRRLELGLLFVCAPATAGKPPVEIVQHPLPLQRRRRVSERHAVLAEMASRSLDLNRGGSSRTPLVTAYREEAIRIACALAELGPQSPRALRALGTGGRTLSILSGNVYGWFERVARGLYGLSDRGRAALTAYPQLVRRYRTAAREGGRAAS